MWLIIILSTNLGQQSDGGRAEKRGEEDGAWGCFERRFAGVGPELIKRLDFGV